MTIPEPILEFEDTLTIEVNDNEFEAELIYCQSIRHDENPPKEKWDVLIEKDGEQQEETMLFNLDERADYNKSDLEINDDE